MRGGNGQVWERWQFVLADVSLMEWIGEGGYLVGASLALGTSCGKSSNQYSKHVI